MWKTELNSHLLSDYKTKILQIYRLKDIFILIICYAIHLLFLDIIVKQYIYNNISNKRQDLKENKDYKNIASQT